MAFIGSLSAFQIALTFEPSSLPIECFEQFHTLGAGRWYMYMARSKYLLVNIYIAKSTCTGVGKDIIYRLIEN